MGRDDGVGPHVCGALFPAPERNGHDPHGRHIADVDKDLVEFQPVWVLVDVVHHGLQGAHVERVLFRVMEALPFPFRVTLVEPQPVFRDVNGKRSLGLAVKGFEFPAYADEVPVSFDSVDFHVFFFLRLLVDGMFLSLLERGDVHGRAAASPEFRRGHAVKTVLVGAVGGRRGKPSKTI